jgi:hypothetical protein
MRRINLAMVVIVTSALGLPVAALAAGAFDGTWKVSLAHVQLSKKPDVYALANGEFTCSSCGPAYTVKADGSDQKVTGHAYDTVAVTADGSTVTFTSKLHGKVLAKTKRVVSGDSMSEEYTDLTGAAPFVLKTTLTRVSAGAAGSDPISGSWRTTKVDSVSDTGASTTYAMTDDGLTMNSNGQSYAVKFDGKKYAVDGDPTHSKVTVKMISPTQVEERYYQGGKLVGINHMTVSADDKTIHVATTDPQVGRTTHYTMDKTS